MLRSLRRAIRASCVCEPIDPVPDQPCFPTNPVPRGAGQPSLAKHRHARGLPTTPASRGLLYTGRRPRRLITSPPWNPTRAPRRPPTRWVPIGQPQPAGVRLLRSDSCEPSLSIHHCRRARHFGSVSGGGAGISGTTQPHHGRRKLHLSHRTGYPSCPRLNSTDSLRIESISPQSAQTPFAKHLGQCSLFPPHGHSVPFDAVRPSVVGAAGCAAMARFPTVAKVHPRPPAMRRTALSTGAALPAPDRRGPVSRPGGRPFPAVRPPAPPSRRARCRRHGRR